MLWSIDTYILGLSLELIEVTCFIEVDRGQYGQKTSTQSYKTQIKIVTFPRLA